MATKSKAMNPAPGPKPGPSKVKKFHPVSNVPVGRGDHIMPTASAAKGGPADPMRGTKAGQGPVVMQSPVKPGKNEMNAVPR